MTAAEVDRAFQEAATGLAIEVAPARVQQFWENVAALAERHATATWVASLVLCLGSLARAPEVGKVCIEKLVAEFSVLELPPICHALFAIVNWVLGGKPPPPDPPVPRLILNATAPMRSLNPTLRPGLPPTARR